MIIDTHAHFVPQPMLDALARRIGDFPSVELLRDGDSYKLSFAGGAPTRPIMPRLRAPEPRQEWMAAQGIDVQVCGGWLDSFGYEIPAQEGAAWSRFVNEHLLAGTTGRGHLAALATVPMQDGRLAAAVLREALAAGFAGAMIGTQPQGSAGNLDDPALDPFWEAASELGATLFLHPMFGCGDPRLLDYDMINAVGRGLDTTTAVARLLYAGHFLRYPGMRFVVAHGGGALPFLLGRLAKNHRLHPEYADPAAGFDRLYFDSVLSDAEALRFLCDRAGAGRVVLGSDYPFAIGDLEPCMTVREAGLDAATERAVLGETAVGLFGIEPAPGG